MFVSLSRALAASMLWIVICFGVAELAPSQALAQVKTSNEWLAPAHKSIESTLPKQSDIEVNSEKYPPWIFDPTQSITCRRSEWANPRNCPDGFVCLNEGGRGYCVVRPRAGERCDRLAENSCPYPLDCVRDPKDKFPRICKLERNSEGQLCLRTGDCKQGLLCDSVTKLCKAGPRLGEDCKNATDSCQPGEYCAVDGDKRVCAKLLSDGAHCTDDKSCLSGSCKRSPTGDGRVCGQPASKGEACDTSSEHCEFGLLCFTPKGQLCDAETTNCTCEHPSGIDERCSEDDACETGICNEVSDRCATGAPGEKCERNRDCATLRCEHDQRGRLVCAEAQPGGPCEVNQNCVDGEWCIDGTCRGLAV